MCDCLGTVIPYDFVVGLISIQRFLARRFVTALPQ